MVWPDPVCWVWPDKEMDFGWIGLGCSWAGPVGSAGSKCSLAGNSGQASPFPSVKCCPPSCRTEVPLLQCPPSTGGPQVSAFHSANPQQSHSSDAWSYGCCSAPAVPGSTFGCLQLTHTSMLPPSLPSTLSLPLLAMMIPRR